MLDPRAIALQGIGFGALQTAIQGFGTEVIAPEPIPDVIPYGSGRMVFPERKQKRRDNDDDVLLFLLR